MYVFFVFLFFEASVGSPQDTLYFSMVEGVNPVETLRHAYSKLGIHLVMNTLPAERGLILSNQGVFDGEVTRIQTISKEYKNLICVPVPIFYVHIVALSKLKINVSNLSSISHYSIGTLRGLKIAEHALHGMKYTRLSTFKQLFEMLEEDKLDLIIVPLSDGIEELNQRKQSKINILSPPITIIPLFHFLHKKHEKLVPKIEQVLRDFEKNGSLLPSKGKRP